MHNEAFLLFQPYDNSGNIMGWTKLQYSYEEIEYTFKPSELIVTATRPFKDCADEDIITSLKDMYTDKVIINVTIN